jgi:hypothetical protein
MKIRPVLRLFAGKRHNQPRINRETVSVVIMRPVVCRLPKDQFERLCKSQEVKA